MILRCNLVTSFGLMILRVVPVAVGIRSRYPYRSISIHHFIHFMIPNNLAINFMKAREIVRRLEKTDLD